MSNIPASGEAAAFAALDAVYQADIDEIDIVSQSGWTATSDPLSTVLSVLEARQQSDGAMLDEWANGQAVSGTPPGYLVPTSEVEAQVALLVDNFAISTIKGLGSGWAVGTFLNAFGVATGQQLVTLLQARVALDQSFVNAFSGQSSGTPPGTGGIGGTGLGLTPGAIGVALGTYLSGDDGEIANLLDNYGVEPTADDGWDYARDVIDTDFTNYEAGFEAIEASTLEGGTDVSALEVGAGVTADVGSLEVVGLAGILLLSEYLFGWAVTYIDSFIPNPSIFGWHPLNFLKEGLYNFGNQFKTSAEGLTKDLFNVFTQPIRQLVGLIQRSLNATAAAHNKAKTLATENIPAAQKAAEHTAAVALSEQVTTYRDEFNQAVTALQPPPTLAQAKQIITDALRVGGVVWDMEAMAATAIVSSDEYADTLKTQTDGQITAAVAKAESDATSAQAKLESAIISNLTGGETTLSALATYANTTVPNEIATAVQAAQAQDQQAYGGTIKALSDQVATLQGQVVTAQANIATAQQSIATATATIATLQSQETVDETAIVAQQQLIITAQEDLYTNTTAISDLQNKITGISTTLGPVQAAQQLNTSNLAPYEVGGAILLPTAIAALSSQLSKLQTQVDTCTVDNCDTTNPNNIRNVLRDLLALFVATAEIGFIAEAVKDPIGTAATLAPGLDAIDASAFATLNALLSL